MDIPDDDLDIDTMHTKSYLRDIQEKTQKLERERRGTQHFLIIKCSNWNHFISTFKEIERKLEALREENSDKLTTPSKQSINKILEELKNQEKMNEAALEILKRRLLNESKQSENFIKKSNSYRNTPYSPLVIPPIISSKNNNVTVDRMNAEEIRLFLIQYCLKMSIKFLFSILN